MYLPIPHDALHPILTVFFNHSTVPSQSKTPSKTSSDFTTWIIFVPEWYFGEGQLMTIKHPEGRLCKRLQQTLVCLYTLSCFRGIKHHLENDFGRLRCV